MLTTTAIMFVTVDAEQPSVSLVHEAVEFFDIAAAVIWPLLVSGYAAAPALMVGLSAVLLIPCLALSAAIMRWSKLSSDRTILLRRKRRVPLEFAPGPDLADSPKVHRASIEFPGTGRIPIGPSRASARDFYCLGRGAENDFVMQGRTVHRNHAAIYRDDSGHFVIADLSSVEGNGVIVNGRPCSEAALADGDIIQLGDSRAVFHAERI